MRWQDGKLLSKRQRQQNKDQNGNKKQTNKTQNKTKTTTTKREEKKGVAVQSIYLAIYLARLFSLSAREEKTTT